MKTLSQEVENIKAARLSNTQKKEMLVALGLSKYEVELLVGSTHNTRPASEVHRLTFGVEIECLCASNLLRNAAQETGFTYQYECYNHTDNKDYYKFVSDASIRGANPIECVSPVLSGKKGIESLRKCCETLNKANAAVNVSTGLHVHIGAANLTDEAYINVFHNYKMCELVIDSFMAKSRRENQSRWCKSLQPFDFSACRTKQDVLRVLNFNRYFKVNACSYERHKTIEFRQHQGTTDFEKINNWVNFLVKLVAYSKKHKINTPVLTIKEVPFLTAKEKRFFTERANQLQ